MAKSPSQLHIGQKIRERAQELNIGSSLLGEMIHTSKQNINGIYKRKTIDADILQKLSKALEFDFFQYYTGFDSRKVKQIQQERQDLRKEIGYLKKINDLLEKGIKK